ncbi:bidirectional sugar transporter SWEET9-like [Punica granatum]|uniref:Bidirectional sugar transporter SWEET n=1 Tax=Punica granatum TaxID=22663 RepID=A0A218W3D8_PUNGR|nr:bidirectional sugar transporter SWEET9-like [Punica granatum]OWM67357.1 hypothetical protein CDL15_Pgr000809 [Punica granatum]
MAFLSVHLLAFIFGLLGNIVGFLVFLAPLPTFITIFKKKSSDGFQSIPYVVALSSAMLLLYYGFLKTDATLIISINAIGIVIELTYLTIYMIYASKGAKMFTLKLLVLFNVLGFGIMLALTMWLLKGPRRVNAVGWICAAFNLAVFAAPLGIMRRVIKTKSVEFMPFTLSFFLTLCATMWFFYGYFVKDMFIALPNVMGFLLGITQMILYVIYKNAEKKTLPTKQQQHEETKLGSMGSGDLCPTVTQPKLTEMNTVSDSSRPVQPNENNV